MEIKIDIDEDKYLKTRVGRFAGRYLVYRDWKKKGGIDYSKEDGFVRFMFFVYEILGEISLYYFNFYIYLTYLAMRQEAKTKGEDLQKKINDFF